MNFLGFGLNEFERFEENMIIVSRLKIIPLTIENLSVIAVAAAARKIETRAAYSQNTLYKRLFALPRI